jgi:hypothetical protein
MKEETIVDDEERWIVLLSSFFNYSSFCEPKASCDCIVVLMMIVIHSVT